MKSFILSFLLCSALASQAQTVKMRLEDHVVDLTKATWQYLANAPHPSQTLQEVLAQEKWQPIQVGQRWEFVGHPELEAKTVWVKLAFRAEKGISNYQVGFFASFIDDEGDVYLNGKPVGSFKYRVGGKIPHPVDIDLTPAMNWGGENTLVVQVRDRDIRRIGGLLGNVCLYKTLPNTLTANGGIRLGAPANVPLGVLLHLGGVRLAQGNQETFSAQELETLHTPPSILRPDELVIVAPAQYLPTSPLKLDLANVSPTTTQAELALKGNPLPDQVGLYEMLKIPVELTASFTNPFDPKQINLYALVETPSGQIEKINGFFAQDFTQIMISEEEEILLPMKGNPWKLYYRPRQKGIHKIEVFVQDRNQMKRLDAGSFMAVGSDHRGYLHPSKVDPRFFEFDNGEPYYGRGPSGWFRGSTYLFGGNIRWVPAKMFQDYYQRKKMNESNFEYLSTFHFGSWYIKGGFIDQHVAYKMETVLRSMEANDIQWIVFHDGILRTFQNGFNTLPYSEAQGGPCREINEVYTHPIALEMQKNELRYMISRMADSPSLWVWNCGDETQPGDKFSKLMVREWMKELHTYIRQNDVYQHQHSIGENRHALLNGSDVLLMGNWYYHEKGGDENNLRCNGEKNADAVAYNLCLQTPYDTLAMPVVNIEGGNCQWEDFTWLSGEKSRKFPEAIDFHEHLWVSFFTKMAAGGTEWLCNILDQTHQLFHAKSFKQFTDDEPFTKVFYDKISPRSSTSELRLFGLQTDSRTLIWVDNVYYNWYNIGYARKPPIPVKSAKMEVPLKKAGTYSVELWDTRLGRLISKSSVTAEGKTLTYNLPEIDKDLAIKLILQ